MTNTERLKTRLEKGKAQLKDIEKQLKAEEQAAQKRLEDAAKLDALSPEISKAIEDILTQAGVTLPQEKQILVAINETGLSAKILEVKAAKGKGGNGGAKAITYEGEQMSWAKLCELKGVARTPGGSAHRDVYNKVRELHDSIPHDCAIDGVTYPTS